MRLGQSLLPATRTFENRSPGNVSQDKFAAINMVPLAESDESRPRKGTAVAGKGRFHAIPAHPKLPKNIPTKE